MTMISSVRDDWTHLKKTEKLSKRVTPLAMKALEDYTEIRKLDNTSMGLEEILRNVHLFLEIRRLLAEEGRFYLNRETIRLFEIREQDLFGHGRRSKRQRCPSKRSNSKQRSVPALGEQGERGQS